MKKAILITIISVFGVSLSLGVYAITWPANWTRHSDIVMTESSYQPSGLAWNTTINKLFTVCNTGKVTMMNPDGSAQDTVIMPSYMDFEAITIVNPNSTKVYIGLENPDSILEYDWQTKSLTGKSWDLTSIMTGADNQGLEGLTFVPNGFHPFGNRASGGVFYAGIQRPPVSGGAVNDDYLIYVFDIDLNVNGKIVNWWGIPVAPNTPNYDIADMYFNQDTEILYVLYDGANRLIEMNTDGTVIKDFSNVPVNEQEGLVIKTSYPSLTADVYLASDSDKLIGWFSGYPVDYDFDKDGVATSLDCNDSDKTVSTNQTFYQDLDKDGLGFGTGKSFCLSAPPIGYVNNHNDLNDNDFDNDGVVTSLDCDDNNKNVWENKIFYKDLDGDGYGNGIPQNICSIGAPAGYVTSAIADCNDNDKNIFIKLIYYQDLDGDKLGSDVSQAVCSWVAPAGYVNNSNDINDNDFDNDGVITINDCNDSDPAISQKKKYYQDLDNDGLGSDVFQTICLLNPPNGFVSNSNDTNDNDHDNDGVITPDDCNDDNNTVLGKQKYYKDFDQDGLGSIFTFAISCTAPNGYVSNSNDANDNDYDNDGVITPDDCNDKSKSILGKKLYYRDYDKDGLGSSASAVLACYKPVGYVSNSNDKNDYDYDNDGVSMRGDCDDKNSRYSVIKTYYLDADHDGFGYYGRYNSTNKFVGCVPPNWFVTNNSDKNDKDPSIH